ncbi:MAG: hypothetical protein HZA48_07590 [Planctomycetes bacterium]|nr:hypothetical protein [Planctomycetota bacterium]
MLKKLLVLLMFSLAALNRVSADEPKPLTPEEQKTVTELAALVRNAENPLRINHLKKLSGFDCPELPDALKACLDDPDEKLACTAMEIIQSKKMSGLFENVTVKIQSKSPVITATAIAAAADMDIQKTLPYLISLLDSPNPAIMETANRLLKKYTGFDYDFNPDGTPEKRSAGAQKWNAWWEKNKNRTQAEWWLNGLTDELAKNRASSCQRLADATDFSSIPQLITTIADESHAVRYFANYALVKITSFDFNFEPEADAAKRTTATTAWLEWWNANKSKQPLDWWTGGLKDASVKVRVSCTLRLQAENNPSSVPYIIELINAPEEIVRAYAKTALERLTGIFIKYDESSTDEKALLKAKNDWLEWWNSNKDKTRLEWLISTLSSHKYSETRASAAESLESYTDEKKKVNPYLFAALNDENARVRESAFISLKNLNALKGMQFDAETPAAERKKIVEKISELLFKPE